MITIYISNHAQIPGLVQEPPGHSHLRMKTLQICAPGWFVFVQIVCIKNAQVSV